MTIEEQEKRAEQASLLAFIGALLMFMMNCGGCFTVFLALPVALWALSIAREVLSDNPTEVTKAYATPARNLSAVVAILSSAFLLFIVAYLTLYLAMIVFVVVGTLASP